MHILSYYGCMGSIIWNEKVRNEFVVCLIVDFESSLLKISKYFNVIDNFRSQKLQTVFLHLQTLSTVFLHLQNLSTVFLHLQNLSIVFLHLQNLSTVLLHLHNLTNVLIQFT